MFMFNSIILLFIVLFLFTFLVFFSLVSQPISPHL